MNTKFFKKLLPGSRWAVIGVPYLWMLVFFAIPELLRLAKFYRLVILGAVIVLTVLFMPGGIVGFVERRWRAWRQARGGR